MERKILKLGQDVFTMLELLKKAASFIGMELVENSEYAHCKPFRTYALDQALLGVLEKSGFLCGNGRTDSIFTISDENPQEKAPGCAPSNYWNFKRKDGEFDLRMSLSVGFGMSTRKRGIILVPQAHGTFFSPVDHLPNTRMFRALVESDPNAPDIAKKVAASEETIMISWTELGIGGLREIADLLEEFANRKDDVTRFFRTQQLYGLMPLLDFETRENLLFLTEPVQPMIFDFWEKELEKYRDKLKV
ncbi:MAG: hypothetical protein WCX27_02355 [Candidatus Paceibacterota bacterium]